MAPVIAAAATYAATISTMAYVQAAIVVVGAARAQSQARKAARQANASLQDRTTPVRQSDAARTIVYGSTRVSGPIIYHRAHGDRRERVSHVIPLAGHEITAVDAVWFNDQSIAPWSGGYVTTGSPYMASRPMSDSVLVAGTGTGQTITLPLNGGTLIAVDTVAWGEAIVDDNGGLPVVRDVAYTVLTPSQYSVAGNVVTISTAETAGHPITVTYRVERGEAKAAVWAFLGTSAGERDTNLETWSGGEWASTAVGNNVARLHVLTIWDETLYATGFPAVSAIVRGKKVYDPRADSTNGGSGSQRADTPSTWAYSDNPALCAADYLRAELGFGCASSEIDWPSVASAANVCDETVPTDAGSGTQKRYVCAGVLSTETERRANLEAILDSMVGIAVYSAGKWTIRAGAYVTPTLDLDEGDLAGGEISIQARANRRDLFNAVRGRYRDPAQLYQVTDFPPYASSTYAAEDGETIYREIDLDMVDDARRAQRIAKLLLFRARQALTIQSTFKLSAYALQPGDTCRLSIARYGWTTKVFRVLRREFQSLTTVRLTLQEDASAIYSWAFSEATTPDPAPNTALADPRFVAVPAGVAFKSDTTTWYARADGTYAPYVEVAWTVPAQDDVYVEVFWKRAPDLEYQRIRAPIGASYVWIEGVVAGDVLNVYLQAVNGVGARSATFWRPSYVVSAVTQPNAAGIVAANWVENATCYNGTEGWFAPTGPNLELRHTRIGVAGAQYVLTGLPDGKGAGLHLHEEGDRPANGVQDAFVGNTPRMVLVEPGQRIEGSVYLSTHRCTADVRVSFYRQDGSYLTEHLLWGPGTVSPEATLQTLAQYHRRGGFTTVPAGAARAVVFVRKYGRSGGTAGDASLVYATRWYLGPALDGQVDLSPWTDGPLRTVGGADIDPGATRRIDSPVILSFGSISGSVKNEWTAVGADASVANFDGTGRRMLVTVTGNVAQFSDNTAGSCEVMGRVQLIGAETINSDSRTLIHIPATASNSTTPYKAGFDATFSFLLPAPLVNAGGTRYLIRFAAMLPTGTISQVVSFNALTVNFDIAR
jgi:hypothetical protein